MKKKRKEIKDKTNNSTLNNENQTKPPGILASMRNGAAGEFGKEIARKVISFLKEAFRSWSSDDDPPEGGSHIGFDTLLEA